MTADAAASGPTTRPLEELIAEWRAFLHRAPALRQSDAAELEDHLRAEIATLQGGGLAADEAFLVAIKRIGALNAIAREFGREHSDRLWKQLTAAPEAEKAAALREGIVVAALAAAAALAVKVPELFGLRLAGADAGFFARNFSLFVLPFLAGYFVWKRGLDTGTWRWLAVAFAAAAVVANTFPFRAGNGTEALVALHLPIVLWLVVGLAYTGARWREGSARMDFVRFSGELFIYGTLIALGGGVLTLFAVGMFEAIGVDVQWLAVWLLPCGALGAVIVGSWLVEVKQSVIENMAPVLTRLFTPLFAVTLLAFLGTMAWTGTGIAIGRDVLIAFDLLLVVVLGLLLYSISARDPDAPPGAFDVVLAVLVVSALVADGVALAAMAARISEFGLTANRVAALGENIVLIVNLAWSARLQIGFLHGRRRFAAVERWQTAYLPAYAAWATIVVVAFPLMFR